MYLSKVSLEKGPALFKLLKYKNGQNEYAAHQILWRLFPNDGNKSRDFLFRKDEKFNMPQFYVVSATKPIQTAGLTLVSKPYTPKLKRGNQLAFSLLANPVVSRKSGKGKTSSKHDVWMDAKITAKKQGITGFDLIKVCENAAKQWLLNQGEKKGFNLNMDQFVVDGYTQNRFFKKGNKRPIQFSSIHYEGMLDITDPDNFSNMLFKGIGRSKSFGCGMMLVKRL